MNYAAFLASLAFLVLVSAFTLSVIFHKLPIAHAQDIETKSDKVQEREYCRMWDTGHTHITNPEVSNMEIAHHCEPYLK